MVDWPVMTTSTPSGYAGWRKPVVLWTLAVIAGGNAIWMLIDPATWFETLPGVVHTGPFNVHLVRDVGCAYLSVGVALALAACWPRAAFPLLVLVALFLSLHAALHVWDIASHRLPSSHVLTDLPLVFLPAPLSIVMALWVRSEWVTAYDSRTPAGTEREGLAVQTPSSVAVELERGPVVRR